MRAALPEGRPGQALALLLTLLAAAMLWGVVAAPALGWYAARQAALIRSNTEAAHMAALAASLPALRRRAAAMPQPAAAPADESGTLAAAALQAAVGSLAADAGASLSSTETLPREVGGGRRMVAVRATVTAPFPALVGLLSGLAQANPAIAVDDMRLRPIQPIVPGADVRLEADLTVTALRAGTGLPGGGAAGDVMAEQRRPME